MEDRFNTIAGWALFSGIVALGLTSLSHKYFEADKAHAPEVAGYPVAGGESAGGEKKGPPFEALLAAADPAKGEAVFKKCASCHTVNQGGANGIGPNLYGVVGEDIGKGRGGYAFSADLAGHTGKWDFANLNAWLENPKKFAPGTKMTFAGLSSAEDRANLIVYLNAQGSNVPLPPVPAADASADAGAAAPEGVDALLAKADPAKGEAAFKKCASCHTINQGGANGIGPNLYGVAGEAIAQGRGGFAFSEALAKHGGNWDAASLDAWLTSPRTFAAGTKMTFAGISDAQQRADLIAYLKAQGGK